MGSTLTTEQTPAGSTGIDSTDLARLRADLVAQFTTTAPAAGGPIRWDRFRAELLELYGPGLRAKATRERIRYVLDLVGALVGPDGTTADLNTGLVVRFIQGRPPESPQTTKTLLNALRTICSYAAGQDYVRVSPFALRKRWIRVSMPKTDTKQHHGLDEIARVLELGRQTIARKVPGSCAHFRAWRTYALAATVAYTGLRKMEALRLWIEDIDVPKRIIKIVERNGNCFKTVGSAVPVCLPDALAAILAEYIAFLPTYRTAATPAAASAQMPADNPTGERQPWWLFPNAYRTGFWCGGSPGNKPLDRVKKLGERAGVKGFTFLSLRHSWATHAESRWGFSEALIQRQLRHTTVKTQKLYRHADPANMRQALAGVSFGDEPAAEVPPAAPVPILDLTPPAPTADPASPAVYRGPKLDDADVAEARELRARGWSYAKLCQRYGIAKSTLHSALYGMTHRDVPSAEEL